nr:hypothetical protein CFP56_11213 [Quercus suber]
MSVGCEEDSYRSSAPCLSSRICKLPSVADCVNIALLWQRQEGLGSIPDADRESVTHDDLGVLTMVDGTYHLTLPRSNTTKPILGPRFRLLTCDCWMVWPFSAVPPDAMVLHHRQNVEDIRFAYDNDGVENGSDQSDHRLSLSVSAHATPSCPSEYISRPSIPPSESDSKRKEGCSNRDPTPIIGTQPLQESPRSSLESTTSSIQSEGDLPEEAPVCDVPELTVPQREPYAIPATPTDFSDLFPSGRRLDISHDETTIDGNMNLRVDTHVKSRGKSYDITLFHLRLHDLKNREFSLRRYCRDSGREVCRTTNKQCKPCGEQRPGLQRSLSSAFNRIRPQSDTRTPILMSLERHDSGYASLHSMHSHDSDHPTSMERTVSPQPSTLPNTIRLEFSNYAQVDVKRLAGKGGKGYEFDYWGSVYTWKRVTRKKGVTKQISYHLIRTGSDEILARIVPLDQDAMQIEQERNMGGWIPQCYLRIVDEEIINSPGKDISDVIVATGLMSLVDSSIRARFRSGSSRRIVIPGLQMGVEYVGPKRLVRGVLRRLSSSSSYNSRPTSSSRRLSSVDSTSQAYPLVHGQADNAPRMRPVLTLLPGQAGGELDQTWSQSVSCRGPPVLGFNVPVLCIAGKANQLLSLIPLLASYSVH